jgi:molecular chaperone DnaJ
MATAAKVDYYEVLGVERDADEDEIRGAFHARARDWHPDVALSEDAGAHFRELAEAYSVLSKRESRLLYDRYGYRGRGNQGLDEAVWEGRQQVERGEDVHLSLELKSYEADRGTRRLVAYTVQSRCETCDGHGVIGERDPSCEICSGTGRAQQVANLEVGRLLQVWACPACGSRACSTCRGRKTVPVERRIRLLIPAGLVDGTQLRVAGDGNDAGAGSVPGDLLVEVNVLEAPRDPRIIRYLALMLLLISVAILAIYVVSH